MVQAEKWMRMGGAADEPYPQDTALRRALLANALFSTFSGLLLLGAPGFTTSVLGAVPELLLRLLGGGLIGFGMAVAVLSIRIPVNPMAAAVVTVADVGWVLGSVTVVLGAGGILTDAGVAAVLGVAGIVALFATLQLRGMALFARNVGGRTGARSRFVLARPVPERPELVWRKVRALDRIGEHSDALARVEVQEVDGVARRTCATKDGDSWTEEVVEMDDDSRELVLRFDTRSGNFPLPVTEMLGGWRVWPHGDGSWLVLWYEFSLRGGLAGEVLAAMADRVFRAQVGPVLDSLGSRTADAKTLQAGRPV